MANMLRVTIKGAILSLATPNPLKAPHRPATTIPARMASGTGTATGMMWLLSSIVTTTPVKPSTEPTERSIPPKIRIKVMPMAINRS